MLVYRSNLNKNVLHTTSAWVKGFHCVPFFFFFLAVQGRGKTHVTAHVRDEVLPITLTFLLLDLSRTDLALRSHYTVAHGSENVGFNWSLFRPFRVRLVESDPSVGCSLSAMIKEHDEASTMPLDRRVGCCSPHFNDQSNETAF